MSGNGMATYFTVDGLTPAALSWTLVIRVWMLLVRFTAMVLPASPAALVMCDDGMATTPKLSGWHAAPATRTRRSNVPLAWPAEVGHVVAAADDVHRAVQQVRQGQRALRDDLRGDGEALLPEVALLDGQEQGGVVHDRQRGHREVGLL